MKVLMVSPHSVSDVRGGAEIAASRLAQALRASQEVPVEVIELFSVSRDPSSLRTVTAQSPTEYGVVGGQSDSLRFISSRTAWENRELEAWLRDEPPDVVHFHHFVGVGSDLLPLVKRVLPNARTAFTAHEMLSFCGKDGKMVKSSGELCVQASTPACTRCLGVASVDVMMRDHYFRNWMKLPDHVITPSQFLADRLTSWDPEINPIVIPNVPPPSSNNSDVQANTTTTVRVGFFGQIIQPKGLHVLLEAAKRALLPEGAKLEILIFGTQPDPHYWETEIEPRMKSLKKGRIRARYEGPYQPADVESLMKLVDWVAVPSIWWENAPTVIIEPMKAQRPVLVGDVGGMREMLDTYGGGICVPIGSIPHWAVALTQLVLPGHERSWATLTSNKHPLPSISGIVERHIGVYGARL